MEQATMTKHGVRISRRYPASPERVFKALVNPEALAQWFAPNDEMAVEGDFDPVVGGRYRVRMKHELGNVYTVGGVYEEVDAPRRLVFTWKWEDEPMSAFGESRVTIELAKIDGGTELTLSHDGFPEEAVANNHKSGWTGCLWRLERLFSPSALQTISVALALNRKLYTNALQDVTPEQLTSRTSDATNHMLWIAGHLAHTRAMMANLLGAEVESELEMFSGEIQPDADYPPLEKILELYTQYTHALIDQIPLADEERLSSTSPYPFPINDPSLLGTISFLTQHEAYHVGQLGLLRKHVGLPATSYADRG